MTSLLFLVSLLTLSSPAVRGTVSIAAPTESWEDAVRASNVIVVGELHPVREWTESTVDCGRGVIDVRQVIWGDVSPGDSLVLEWRDHALPFMFRPPGDLTRLVYHECIWLLASSGQGAFRAATPDCVHPAGQQVRTRIEETLAAAPAMIWIDEGSYPKSGPVLVTLGYRNFSNQAREFPGLAFSDGVLRVDPRVSVDLTDGPVVLVPPHAGHLVVDGSLPPLRVQPMSELGVTFDLRAVFPLRGRSFVLTYKVAGQGDPRSQSVLLL